MASVNNWHYETPEELEAAGYRFLNESRCRGKTCGAFVPDAEEFRR